MGKKKILQIQLLPLMSGVQKFMLTLLSGLDPNEFEIHVACRPCGPLVREIKRRGYIYHPLYFFKHEISPLDAVVFYEIYRLCRKENFDIVHTHSSKPGFLGRLAARLAKVPLVIHTSNGSPIHPDQNCLTRRFYMELERFSDKFCDKVVFVNNYHRLFYLQHKLITPAKAVTIYNAITPEQTERIQQAAAKRKPMGKIVTIGSVCRFSKEKNILLMVLAAIHICRSRQDADFIFAGDGELFPLCRKIVVSNNLQDRIIFPGWKDEPAEILAQLDVFLIYSSYEGMPLSVIEAMTAGLPILSSDIPMLRELVDDSCGMLIKPNDLDALETALNNMLDLKADLRQKGIMSKKKVEMLCSYDQLVQAYRSLYVCEGK